jgi:hypothetical protein
MSARTQAMSASKSMNGSGPEASMSCTNANSLSVYSSLRALPRSVIRSTLDQLSARHRHCFLIRPPERTAFRYQPETDSFLCPAGQTLERKQLARKDRAVVYQGQPAVCGACALKPACTLSSRRLVTRHLDEEALNR